MGASVIRLGAYFGTADYTTCKMPVTVVGATLQSRRMNPDRDRSDAAEASCPGRTSLSLNHA
jgi:hypothetical protein